MDVEPSVLAEPDTSDAECRSPTVAAPISLSRQGWVGIRRYAYPVDVENIDVARAQLLEGRLDGDVHRLNVVARVVRFLRNVLRRPLEVRCVLMQHNQVTISRNPVYHPEAEASARTLVARTIWSRIPRFSIHSPMNSSEDSSWLCTRQLASRIQPHKMRRTSCWRYQ